MTDPNPFAWEWAELRQRHQKFLLMGPEGSPSDRLQLYANSEECLCLPVFLRPLERWGFHVAVQLQDFPPIFLCKGRFQPLGLGAVILRVICEQSTMTIPCLSALLSSACSDTIFMGFNHFLRYAAS